MRLALTLSPKSVLGTLTAILCLRGVFSAYLSIDERNSILGFLLGFEVGFLQPILPNQTLAIHFASNVLYAIIFSSASNMLIETINEISTKTGSRTSAVLPQNTGAHALEQHPMKHVAMKHVGKRIERPISNNPAIDGMLAASEHTQTLSALCGGRVMFPKGVFRYKSHEEANAHQERCLVEGMARLAKERHE